LASKNNEIQFWLVRTKPDLIFEIKKRIQNMILFSYITRPTNRFLMLFSCGIGMRTGTQIFEKKAKQNVTRKLRAH
jgi:hypothetical protein